jgi:hypothetical protein
VWESQILLQHIRPPKGRLQAEKPGVTSPEKRQPMHASNTKISSGNDLANLTLPLAVKDAH